jgi:hypothetical protein
VSSRDFHRIENLPLNLELRYTCQMSFKILLQYCNRFPERDLRRGIQNLTRNETCKTQPYHEHLIKPQMQVTLNMQRRGMVNAV